MSSLSSQPYDPVPEGHPFPLLHGAYSLVAPSCLFFLCPSPCYFFSFFIPSSFPTLFPLVPRRSVNKFAPSLPPQFPKLKGFFLPSNPWGFRCPPPQCIFSRGSLFLCETKDNVCSLGQRLECQECSAFSCPLLQLNRQFTNPLSLTKDLQTTPLPWPSPHGFFPNYQRLLPQKTEFSVVYPPGLLRFPPRSCLQRLFLFFFSSPPKTI